MNAFAYLIRRETWEHKALYRAPLITAVVLVALALLALFKGAAEGHFGAAGRFFEYLKGINVSPDMIAQQYLQIISPISMAAIFGIIFTVGTIVAVFYLLDSLYAERKNRSILFWKSLPISDTETVLSKKDTAVFGRSVFLYDGIARDKLVELGDVRTPSVADLFVAKVRGEAA